MATIEPYDTQAGRRWRVRYRRPDRRQTDKRGFKTKRDAKAFAATVETSKLRGAYVNPSDGRITVGELGEAWLARQTHVKPSTLRRNTIAWQQQVRPEFGALPVSQVTHSHIRAWLSDLTASMSASSVRIAFGVLRGILSDAEKDKLIASAPISGHRLPKKAARRKKFLTHVDVEAIAREAKYPTLVRLLAYTGLRWGEAAGLTVGDLNFLRRRINIERSATRVGSRVEVGPVKTWESRTVPMPPFLVDDLARQCEDKQADDLLFSEQGRHLTSTTAVDTDGWLTTACRRAGVERVTPHDLRHTAASLAVQAGAHVKVLQRMLGHSSAAVTLDTYSMLFDDDLDSVAGALSDARDAQLRQS